MVTPDTSRSTPQELRNRLLIAACAGNAELVTEVLRFGAAANDWDPASGQTPLMMAAGRGHTEVVTAIIAAGADPNAVDRRAGATALHKASQGGHLEVTRALVAANAYIDHQASSTGHTPLIEAIWFKSVEVVQWLLSIGARLDPKTYYGFTIDDHIQFALKVNQGQGREKLLKIQQLVAERREAIAHQMAIQSLNAAVLSGDVDKMRTALDDGASLEERYPVVGSFSDGHTPLLIASRDGHTEMVKSLIAKGANVNAIEPVFGAVPLHKATYNGNLDITRVLAAADGVDLNYQGPSNGYTPLHDALWHGFADCAAVLLEAGARTDIVAYDGKLPVDIAIQELGLTHDIVARLKAKGSRSATDTPKQA